eukprot:3018068-Pyramimonas_sp.AAC.1
MPAPLSSIDRTTGEVYHHLARLHEHVVPELVPLFQRNDRTCMSDGDGAIARDERNLSQAPN